MEEKIEKILKEHEKRIKNLEKNVKKLFSLLPKRHERKIKIKENIVDKFRMLNLSEFSYIYKLSGLPLFLAIIKIALEKFEIDGLTPPEISRICKEKLRISKGTDRTTISHTLAKAREYVDRIPNPRGKGYAYRIMRRGEEFLNEEIRKVMQHGKD